METLSLTKATVNKAFLNTDRFTSPENTLRGEKKQMLGSTARARALETSAAILEAEADAMRRQAQALRARLIQKEVEKGRRVLWKKVAAAMERGMSEDAAISYVAAGIPADASHVRYWWDWAHKNAAAYRLWNRDREIMRMARIGYTNKEIASSPTVAQWHGGPMHEKSISRIISRKIKRK